MLTRAHRLTSSRLFAPTIRRGARAGARTIVVHMAVPDAEAPGSPVLPTGAPSTGPLVGFVVSKAVGGAVTRNQVKRRLRHLVRERLTSLPESAVLVIRALPPAAGASSAELGADLDRTLGRLRSRGSTPSVATAAKAAP